MVRSAMIYPTIIAFMAICTTVFLLIYVLPKFVMIFEGRLVAADDDSAADGRNAALTHTAAVTGAYTVRVTANPGTGGEYVLSPEQVMQAGGGDLETGHRVLDEFVKRMRAQTVKTLKNLPGPKKD